MAIVTDLLGRGLRGIFLPYAPPLVAFNISPFAISNLSQTHKIDKSLSVYTGSTWVVRRDETVRAHEGVFRLVNFYSKIEHYLNLIFISPSSVQSSEV
ncbi:hypothetical protein N7516_003647 [Penicillium verrucosum]|uniref:uncharacterized protein n=1 Tax=Penicillium verrucosum TaxID=60171 RepID=UPI002544DE7A|nr:uncharacterized protein N7516_003647 [Penicillium verrucosum]KAJ5943479.1 hypothetical protein N7516_003647 [Penicillium verrucosum]